MCAGWPFSEHPLVKKLSKKSLGKRKRSSNFSEQNTRGHRLDSGSSTENSYPSHDESDAAPSKRCKETPRTTPVTSQGNVPPPDEDVIVLGPGEDASVSSVLCHYCGVRDKRVAVKTCLVCGASMCPEHLRVHLESPVFQCHPLVNAVHDVSPWRCLEHQEMNRIYCQDCEECVCTVCTVIGSHKEHSCVSLKEAENKLRVSSATLTYYYLCF